MAKVQNPSEMPAGDARREAMREAADTLAQAAEESGADGGAIDPRALEIENEIAQHFNELEVTNADPAYAYCWVNFGFGGRFIKQKMAHRVPEDGGLSPVWEVVQGEMPEAPELRGIGADSTRRLGDVLLMRARKDRAILLRRQQTTRQRALEGAPLNALQEMGDKYRHLGVVVHTNPNDQLLKTMETRAATALMAQQQVDNMLRAGTVPGLGRPGSRRTAG